MLGLLKIWFNVTVWLLPAVMLLLSAGAIDSIFTPFDVFSSSSVPPRTSEVALSTARSITRSEEMIKSTYKVKVELKKPPPAIPDPTPTRSLTFKEDKLNDPPSELTKAEVISSSFGS